MKVAQQSADVIVRLSMLLLDQYYGDGKGQSIGTSTTDLPESQETPCYLTPLTDFLLVPRCSQVLRTRPRYPHHRDTRYPKGVRTQHGSQVPLGLH